MSNCRSPPLLNFYPRPPRGGRLPAARWVQGGFSHFYPRPPRGGRPAHTPPLESRTVFLSTPSARRATRCASWQTYPRYFYPRPPRGGRPSSLHASIIYLSFLSTPSARRATPSASHTRNGLNISIHALREEGDVCFAGAITSHQEFLSTPSARRATLQNVLFPCVSPYFYPRPPRGGRPSSAAARASAGRISIHALREEGDCAIAAVRPVPCISIHALREEGDSKNGEKHLRFCFIIKRSAQIWKSLSKNIRKNSCDLHRTA